MKTSFNTKVMLSILAAGAFLVGASWAVANDYELYASMYDESFVWVDPGTPALNLIGDIGDFAPRAMTYDFDNDIIYAINNQDDPELAVIDPQTGIGTTLGPFTLPDPDFVGRSEALAFNPEDGLLYCSVSINNYNTTSEALATIDPVTQEVTVLGTFSGTFANDGDAMVFIDGVLYVIDDPHLGPSYFYEVDHLVHPGMATLVGILNNPRFNNVNDMTFDPETRTLYGYDPHERLLITIDWLTGQGTLLGSTHEPPDFGFHVMSAITVGPPYVGISGTENPPSPELSQFRIAPNPFNPMTTISFNLQERGTVSVGIYDLQGRLIKALVRAEGYAAGDHSISWRGRDDHGREMPSGAYLVRIEVGEKVMEKKISLIK